jgi:hypothetical protein
MDEFAGMINDADNPASLSQESLASLGEAFIGLVQILGILKVGPDRVGETIQIEDAAIVVRPIFKPDMIA